MEATKEQLEMIERTLVAHEDFGDARAELDRACVAMAIASEAVGRAICNVGTTARALGALVVELPVPAESESERSVALDDMARWIGSAKACAAGLEEANEAMIVVGAVIDAATVGGRS